MEGFVLNLISFLVVIILYREEKDLGEGLLGGVRFRLEERKKRRLKEKEIFLFLDVIVF